MKRGGSVGRVLDWGLKGFEFENYWSHYVLSLSKTLYPLLSTGSTQDDISEKIIDMDIKHQREQTINPLLHRLFLDHDIFFYF